MIGLSAFMMLGCGLWFLMLGGSFGSHYGSLAAISGAMIGFAAGVFAGAAWYELDSELTLRCGVAREEKRYKTCALWLGISAAIWLSVLAAFVSSVRFIAR